MGIRSCIVRIRTDLIAWPWRRILPSAAGIMALLVLLLFTLGYALAPVYQLRTYRNYSEADSVFISQYDQSYDHPDLEALLKDLAHTKASLEISSMDSIQIIVNLRDSLVLLSLHGVTLHEARVTGLVMDPFLESLPVREYLKIFSEPVRVDLQKATIVKEPIVVRHAPENPNEALQDAFVPDTMVQRPAFFLLSLQPGIRVIFEQDINRGIRDHMTRLRFRVGIAAGQTLGVLADFLCFRRQEYRPRIIIRLPAEDLRAIYRALPSHASVVLAY